MNLYLDASALVKCFIAEAGSMDVLQLIAEAKAAGTVAVSRAEVAAALAKAARLGALPRDEASKALDAFRKRWPSLVRLDPDEDILALAEAFAWEYGLRGYDAVHLATAASWQRTLGEPVTLATFDQQLWQAAPEAAVAAWPEGLSRPNRG